MITYLACVCVCQLCNPCDEEARIPIQNNINNINIHRSKFNFSLIIAVFKSCSLFLSLDTLGGKSGSGSANSLGSHDWFLPLFLTEGWGIDEILF